MVTACNGSMLEDNKKKLKDMALPPLSSSFNTKQTPCDAICKRNERLKKVVQDIPPTNPGRF